MPRRPNIERPTALNLKLPESMRARLDLILWSEVEGCVPKGRYQQFFLGLLQQYFDQLKESANVQPRDSVQDGPPPLEGERRLD